MYYPMIDNENKNKTDLMLDLYVDQRSDSHQFNT